MNIQTFLTNILDFLNDVIVPGILAIAFLAFIWNMARYFIFQGGDEKKHSEARQYAIWSIAAFVVIVSLWGIVNLLVQGFNFGPNQPITPDYMGSKGGNTSGNGTFTNSTTGDTYGETLPSLLENNPVIQEH